jgi:hypothetical protein
VKQPNIWSKPAGETAAWSPVDRSTGNWSPERDTTEDYTFDDPTMTFDQDYVFFDYMQNNNTLNNHLETAWSEAIST